MSTLMIIATAIEDGKSKIVASLVEAALAKGYEPTEILNTGMLAAMGRVGEKFKNNEIFVPEMLIAARAMKKGMAALGPHLVGEKRSSNGKFIIGTVEGDLHDIGKNLVAMMVGSAGFEVIDLGVDVSADKFVQAVKENPSCKIVGLSSLLTTTMPAMKETIDALLKENFDNGLKIMVGGAPLTAEYAARIGADAYSPDAVTAAETAKQLVRQ